MWEPQWKALTERFRSIRCDLRGFGDTPLPAERFNPADDVIRLLDALDIKRANVVGSSFGGRVALELAATWPRRVRKLVLLCGEWEEVESDPQLESFASEEDRLLSDGDVDGAVELNVRTWLGPDASSEHRALVATMQRHSFEVQLAAGGGAEFDHREVDPGAIDAPTLVISGGRDLPHFRQVATELSTRIPDAEHVELEWASHLPSLERPDEITQLLLGYLAST